MLAAARSTAMLFASRLLDGATGGNISVAQAYIADVIDERNRAKGLGLIGAAFGLGFIIGPARGGALSGFGYAARQGESGRSAAPFTLAALTDAMRRPRVGTLLHTRIFFGLAFAVFQTVFALWA